MLFNLHPQTYYSESIIYANLKFNFGIYDTRIWSPSVNYMPYNTEMNRFKRKRTQ